MTPQGTTSRRPGRRRRLALGAALALLSGPALLAGCGGSRGPAPVPLPAPSGGRGTPFATTSFWNEQLPAEAPAGAGSAQLVHELTRQVASTHGAAFNIYQYNAPIYVVPADQRTVDVTFDNCQHKPAEPDYLKPVFTAVPFPATAQVNKDTDRSVDLYQPSTDTLWEFWKAARKGGRWHACYGGRLDHVSTSDGIFPGYQGASASGLPALGGEVKVAEVRAGSIDHVMALELSRVRSAKVWSWPARRSDGRSHEPAAIAEGQRFQLDPKLDLATLHLNPVELMIAKAAQTYGFVVTDTSGDVAMLAESPLAYLAAGQPDPWKALLNGVHSYEVLRHFPWDRLKALPFDYGQP